MMVGVDFIGNGRADVVLQQIQRGPDGTSRLFVIRFCTGHRQGQRFLPIPRTEAHDVVHDRRL